MDGKASHPAPVTPVTSPPVAPPPRAHCSHSGLGTHPETSLLWRHSWLTPTAGRCRCGATLCNLPCSLGLKSPQPSPSARPE